MYHLRLSELVRPIAQQAERDVHSLYAANPSSDLSIHTANQLADFKMHFFTTFHMPAGRPKHHLLTQAEMLDAIKDEIGELDQAIRTHSTGYQALIAFILAAPPASTDSDIETQSDKAYMSHLLLDEMRASLYQRLQADGECTPRSLQLLIDLCDDIPYPHAKVLMNGITEYSPMIEDDKTHRNFIDAIAKTQWIRKAIDTSGMDGVLQVLGDNPQKMGLHKVLNARYNVNSWSGGKFYLDNPQQSQVQNLITVIEYLNDPAARESDEVQVAQILQGVTGRVYVPDVQEDMNNSTVGTVDGSSNQSRDGSVSPTNKNFF